MDSMSLRCIVGTHPSIEKIEGWGTLDGELV